MATAISTSTTACLSTFNEFIEDIRQNYGSNELGTKGLVVRAWEDELGRLRIWAANIGAHQTGCSSLDFRLRDASHIRGQITTLLDSLRRKLQDTKVALAEEEHDDVEVIDDLVDPEDAKTEAQELQEGLATIIDCLFQMSMLVRKPAPHDLRLGSKDAEVAAFEQYDYNHVRGKYPRADDALVKRLGNAITLRSKYLVYRERHAMKLRQDVEDLAPVAHDLQDVQEGGTVTEVTKTSNTVATDFQPDVAFDDNASDSDVSQTSYTPTSVGGENITIPLAPKNSLGGLPFECPYCFYVITVSGSRSWIKHVFQDLPPYICVAPTCLTPDKLYSTKYEWLQHSHAAHPAVNSDYNAPQSNSVLCPLCREDVKRGNNHDRHLARHLEELALFILPRSDEKSDTREPCSDSGKGGSRVSEDESSEMDDRLPEITIVQRLIPMTSGGESLGDPESASSFRKLALSENEAPSDTKQEPLHEEGKLVRQLKENQEASGERQLETLASMESLALSYRAEGKFQEAELVLRQVAAMRTRILGAEHPDTLSSKTNLAHILVKQIRGIEAKELLESTLVKQEMILGRDHPSTLETVRVLGDVFFEVLGSPAAAESFYIRALTGYEKTCGSEHSLTLNIVQLLGGIRVEQNRLAEALHFYDRVLTGHDKVYGREHLSTLNTMLHMGYSFTGSGKLEEARAFYKRALDGYAKVYGRENPLVIDIMVSLGDNSARRGELVMAERYYREALSKCDKLYGSEHESTLKTAQLLRNNLVRQGKRAEDEMLQKWAPLTTEATSTQSKSG